MKSIKAKLRCCLAVLLLGLFSFSSAMAQDVPTDSQVEEALNTADAKTLHGHLLSQGFTDNGIIPGSAGLYSDPSSATLNRSSISPLNRDQVVIIVIIIVAKEYRHPNGAVFQASYALEKYSDGTSLADASAEGATSVLSVSGPTVVAAPKLSVSSILGRFDRCWRQFGGDIVQNCTACYNCLKGCLVNSWPRWRKLLCTLRCVPSCARCIRSVIAFVRCVIG
jgi:hypothetical protein